MPYGIQGTPKDLTIRDSFIGGIFGIGPVYGVTERITLINSHIQQTANEFQEHSAVLDFSYIRPFFSNGTITIPVGSTAYSGTWSNATSPSVCPIPWAIPGAKIAIFTNVSTISGVHPELDIGMMGAFTVMDVRTDGSNSFIVDTDLAVLPTSNVVFTASITAGTKILTVSAFSGANPGACLLNGMIVTGPAGVLPAGTIISIDLGVPNGTAGIGSYTLNNAALTTSTGGTFTASCDMAFLPHVGRFTSINCIGGRLAADWAGAPPDIPMYSYFQRAFAGFGGLTSDHEAIVGLSGNLTSLTINVTKPYTGSLSTYNLTIALFGYINASGNLYPTYNQQIINLKTTGPRIITITPAGGTSVPTATGDTFTTTPFWLSGGHWVTTPAVGGSGDTLDKMPEYIIRGQANQGITPSMTVFTSGGVSEFADTVLGANLT